MKLGRSAKKGFRRRQRSRVGCAASLRCSRESGESVLVRAADEVDEGVARDYDIVVAEPETVLERSGSLWRSQYCVVDVGCDAWILASADRGLVTGKAKRHGRQSLGGARTCRHSAEAGDPVDGGELYNGRAAGRQFGHDRGSGGLEFWVASGEPKAQQNQGDHLGGGPRVAQR